VSKPLFINAATSRARQPGAVFRAMLRGFVTSPYAAYRLTLKDVKGGYARSLFGLLWDLADPLVFGAIFYFLVAGGVLHPGKLEIPYPLFVTYGMLLYQTFTEALLSSMRLFKSSRGLLAHVKIAPETLLLSVFFRCLFNSAFRIVVLLLLTFGLLGVSLDRLAGFGLLLLCWPLLIGAGMAIGVALAPLNAIYADVERATSVLLVPLRFATPVFYSIGSTALILCNPVAVLIVNLRDLGTGQGFYHAPALVLWSAGLGLLFMVATYVFHVAVPVLAERT
jgi:ABC-type polysaccharide/polyol phosphate export permease